MGKVFEDYFSELQTDMVEICLEYVEDRAEKIYIYSSFEGGVQSCNFFYKVNGKVVKKSRLNDVIVDGSHCHAHIRAIRHIRINHPSFYHRCMVYNIFRMG